VPTREELETWLEEALEDEADAASRVALYEQQLVEGDYDNDAAAPETSDDD